MIATLDLGVAGIVSALAFPTDAAVSAIVVAYNNDPYFGLYEWTP